MEAKHISTNVEQYPSNQAFITIEDHKPSFPYSPKCRLINPAKSYLGRINSQLLNEINVTTRKKSGLQIWRNTAAVILWFKNFPYSGRSRFFTFVIVDFYSSISKKLLEDSICFAKQWVEIDDETCAVIKHCRKSLLFSRDSA